MRTFLLDAQIQGQRLDSIIDTGATFSAVAKKFTRNAKVNPTDTMAIMVGNGEVLQSLGSTEVEVLLGLDLRLLQRCQVVDTNAFDCVLGTDFIHSGPVNGLLLRPARLIVNNQEVPLREESGAQHLHRMVRVPTEDYKLRSDLRFEALSKLGVSPSQLVVDLFASPKNTQESLFATRLTQHGSTIGSPC